MKYIYIVYFFQTPRRSSTITADPSRRLSASERKFGYADLLEEIGVPRFLVEHETYCVHVWIMFNVLQIDRSTKSPPQDTKERPSCLVTVVVF